MKTLQLAPEPQKAFKLETFTLPAGDNSPSKMKTCTLPPDYYNPSIENLHATTGPQKTPSNGNLHVTPGVQKPFKWKPSRCLRVNQSLQSVSFTIQHLNWKPRCYLRVTNIPQLETSTLSQGHQKSFIGNPSRHSTSIGSLHITPGSNILQLETSTLPQGYKKQSIGNLYANYGPQTFLNWKPSLHLRITKKASIGNVPRHSTSVGNLHVTSSIRHLHVTSGPQPG